MDIEQMQAGSRVRRRQHFDRHLRVVCCSICTPREPAAEARKSLESRA
jgi:hypothetical protein